MPTIAHCGAQPIGSQLVPRHDDPSGGGDVEVVTAHRMRHHHRRGSQLGWRRVTLAPARSADGIDAELELDAALLSN
jgi:hypothetical protein